jgi:tRNA U34 5-carboxymethylaminomethyl modifying GTPase MnmE/TrmE
MTDTAGLRSQTEDQIEKEGIEIAKDELAKAHSVILVLDVTDLTWVEESYSGNGTQRAYRLRPRTIGLNAAYRF